MSKALRYGLAGLVVLLVGGIAVTASLGLIHDLPFQARKFVPGADKLAHGVLYGLVALTLNLALYGRRVRVASRPVLLGSALALLAGTVDEFANLLVETRGFDVLDLGANALGVLLLGRLGGREAQSAEGEHERLADEGAVGEGQGDLGP